MPHRPLRDAHVHLPQHGRAAEMISFGDCTSKESLLSKLADAAGSTKDADPGRWVLGMGVRVESWPEPAYPTAAEIDDVIGSMHCCIWSFDYHAIVASSAALRAAGITPDTPDPAGGVIFREADRGRPSGLLLEAAAHLVWDSVPEPSPGQRRGHVLRAANDMSALGFVEVHELKSPLWLGPLLAELDDAGELPISVDLFPLLEDIERVVEQSSAWRRDRVRLGGGKIFVDGTLNSRTAHMLSEYADPMPDHPRGTPMMTPDEIDDAIRRVDALGVPLAVHAIGDAAVRGVFDAIERVRPRTQGFRIEHAEIIDEVDIDRFADLGVACSPQPCHLLPDMEVLRRLLPHRLDRVFPLRELIDAGCKPGELLWFGSDTPIVRPDPKDSIQGAVARRREVSQNPIAPEQAISEDEAWAAFTAD